MPKAKVGGYQYNQEIAQARIANKAIRDVLRLLDERPGPETFRRLLLKAALASNEIMEAIDELDKIGRNCKNGGQE